MMGKGAEGGCTTNGCTGSAVVGILPLSKALVHSGSVSRMSGNVGHERRGSDVFSQALKALAVKPAFGELGTSTSGASSLNTSISSENKRKHRTKKNDTNGNLLRDPFDNSWFKDSNGSPFWLLMDEYFREPLAQDIQLLVPKTRFDMGSLCGSVDSLLQMPVSGFPEKSIVCEAPGKTQWPLTVNSLQLKPQCQVNQTLQAPPLEQDAALKTLEQRRKLTKRKLVTSGGVSKRRRTMSSSYDVITEIISPRENDDEELCDVCCSGESHEMNKILFCDSCNAAVHQECYGVKVVPQGQWLCNLCKHQNSIRSDIPRSGSHDCAFCPVKGGALKPIASRTEQLCSESTDTRFGHLFCCQWIPETYIGDTEAMEPIMNIEEVREERWKLLCSICKNKHGACIQCSHGMCATAFHPLCARQAKLRMEVCSRANGDEVDLHAFCWKHTVLNDKPEFGRWPEVTVNSETANTDRGTMNRRSFTKIGKRLKTSSKFDKDQLPVDSTVDTDGSPHNREIPMNGCGDMSSISGAGLMEKQDSSAVKANGNLNIENGQEHTLSRSVMEEACHRLDDLNNVHPCLIDRLSKMSGSICPRDTESDTEKTAEFSCFSDGPASVFVHTQVPDAKVSRGMGCHSQISSHKCGFVSKSAKIELNDSLEAQLKQLDLAAKIGVLDVASGNELEEEILASQLSLVSQAQGNSCRSEQLLLKIIPRLSHELRAHRKRLKDLNLVTQYLSLLREAKKLGRKERRSKEAQAILAATTAVAAASSRLGASRKDASVSKDENLLARDALSNPIMATSQSFVVCHGARSTLRKPLGYGWSSSSQTSSCGKASPLDQEHKPFESENHAFEFNSGESLEELILCDICKETSVSSRTAICQRCEAVVHQQCYGVNSIVTRDWLCQPCLEIRQQSQCTSVSDVVERATPGHGVLCFLCFGLSGAFKKAANGKWAHVFCLQWFPEFSDKDEAVLHEPTKMFLMEKIVQECSICHLKQGARLRCSFGHCHGAFHPLCARDSGLYMSVKRSTGGRIQLRAYCEKHSSQQRQKAASRKYGSSDELNVLLQMRTELERVRILCERVCKRERLKRERLLCTLDIYTAQRSSLSSSAMASNDLSSTSNTFGTTVTFRKMSSFLVQQNDAMAVRHHHHGLESESLSWNSAVGEGSKYQDSLSSDSVYQTQISCSEPSRETHVISQLTDAFNVQGRMNLFVGTGPKNCEQRRLGKHYKGETSLNELIMTPMEASVQNQRLPKGYAYVPVGPLPKGRFNISEASILKNTGG